MIRLGNVHEGQTCLDQNGLTRPVFLEDARRKALADDVTDRVILSSASVTCSEQRFFPLPKFLLSLSQNAGPELEAGFQPTQSRVGGGTPDMTRRGPCASVFTEAFLGLVSLLLMRMSVAVNWTVLGLQLTTIW